MSWHDLELLYCCTSNASGWTKAAFAYSVIYTHTQTKLTCPDWVFTALKQVLGSKQQLPQKQNGFKCLWKCSWEQTNIEHDEFWWEHITEDAFVRDRLTWKETLVRWNRKCTTTAVLKMVESTIYTDCTRMMGTPQAGILTTIPHISPRLRTHKQLSQVRVKGGRWYD